MDATRRAFVETVVKILLSLVRAYFRVTIRVGVYFSYYLPSALSRNQERWRNEVRRH